MCVHFCYKIFSCGIWDWCIVGFVQQVYTNHYLFFQTSLVTPEIIKGYDEFSISTWKPSIIVTLQGHTDINTYHMPGMKWSVLVQVCIKCKLLDSRVLKIPYIWWNHYLYTISSHYMDGLVQERHDSSTLAMELLLYCINPSICGIKTLDM